MKSWCSKKRGGELEDLAPKQFVEEIIMATTTRAIN